MKGDTLLNGITYHKIYYSLDLAYDSPNQSLHCFVREDTTKKLFVKYPAGLGIDTTEFMLYNFNLVTGDTVTIRLFYFNTDSVYKLKVTAIFPIPMNSIDTPIYYRLEPLQSPAWFCTNFTNFAWIEGFGSSLGPLYNEIPEWGCDDGGYEVSCFWHRGVYVWGGTFCDYTTGINEIKKNDNDLEIYPNPAKDAINIVFNDEDAVNAIAEIRDVLGKLIERMPLKVGVPFNYTTQSLEPAIYFISLYVDGKLVEKKKLVLIK